MIRFFLVCFKDNYLRIVAAAAGEGQACETHTHTHERHKSNSRVCVPLKHDEAFPWKDLHIRSVPVSHLHPLTLERLDFFFVYEHRRQQASARLMKTIQVNQVYQRPKASVIWENCWNSKVIFCNVILPIEHWLYCTCRIRAQSFSSNAVLTSSMDIHLQVIIILVLSALILKWLI